MFYSYVMGIDENIYILETEGFVIEKDNENYQVSFPESIKKMLSDNLFYSRVLN